MKKLEIKDEHGVPWTVLQDQALYDGLAKIKLEADEYACWRSHLIGGFSAQHVHEAKQRLQDITLECYEASEPNEPLLERLLHAARAYISESRYYASLGGDRGDGSPDQTTQAEARQSTQDTDAGGEAPGPLGQAKDRDSSGHRADASQKKNTRE